MSIVRSLREMRPYHLLLLAVLAAVVLAQVAAMVLVTRSQVQKAQAHYAQAPIGDTAMQPVRSAVRPPPAKDGVVKVGFVVAR